MSSAAEISGLAAADTGCPLKQLRLQLDWRGLQGMREALTTKLADATLEPPALMSPLVSMLLIAGVASCLVVGRLVLLWGPVL